MCVYIYTHTPHICHFYSQVYSSHFHKFIFITTFTVLYCYSHWPNFSLVLVCFGFGFFCRGSGRNKVDCWFVLPPSPVKLIAPLLPHWWKFRTCFRLYYSLQLYKLTFLNCLLRSFIFPYTLVLKNLHLSSI